MPSKTKKCHPKRRFRKTAKGGKKNESESTNDKKKELISIMENSAKTKKEKNMLEGYRRTFIRQYINENMFKTLKRRTPLIGYGINIDTPLDDLPYKLVKKIYSNYMEYLNDKQKSNKTKTKSSKLNTLRSKMKTIEESITDPDTLYVKYEHDLKHSKNPDTVVKAALGMSVFDPKRRNKTVRTKSA